MKLSKDIFDTLVLELEKTPKVTESEFNKRATSVPEFARVKNKTSKILATSELIHYSTRNENLNKIISDITKRKTSDILSLHTIESLQNSETKPHVDTLSDLTLNILLKDEFEGGKFYLNGELYNNLTKKGDYVMYKGNEETHAVTIIKAGVRKTLIVWYHTPRGMI
jgi:hypothetical protein